jgi:hypothetical protein
MRTATIELPDAVFDRLASAANREHKPVPAYISDLLTGHATVVAPAQRVEPKLPLIPSRRPGSVELTNQKIAELESQEDAHRYGRSA